MLSSKKIIAALIADGWVQVHQKGSHVQFRHPRRLGRVTVPHPKKDLPLGTIRSIEQQSGVKLT
jgi:predicted RNA binding protein YcfA (HicA-like mRNA interferase family)